MTCRGWPEEFSIQGHWRQGGIRPAPKIFLDEGKQFPTVGVG
jgi:hypothetical protein